MVLDLVHTSEAEMDQEHSEDFFFSSGAMETPPPYILLSHT